MKKYSKCAIYTLEKYTNNQGQSFYEATLLENTYNPKIPYKNKWETTFYKCQIYTDIELEIANFDLELDKNKYSFINISNPEKSIIRVLDFEYTNRTIWKGQTQLKDDRGKAKIKRYIAITQCEYDKQGYKTEERKLVELEKRIKHFKEVNTQLRKEIKNLKKELSNNEEKIEDTNEEVDEIIENEEIVDEVINKSLNFEDI